MRGINGLIGCHAKFGTATVYRMINLLEEIGAISRKNMYRISCGMGCDRENVCLIELEDDTVCHLSAQNWYRVITEGLRACGYIKNQKVISVVVESKFINNGHNSK